MQKALGLVCLAACLALLGGCRSALAPGCGPAGPSNSVGRLGPEPPQSSARQAAEPALPVGVFPISYWAGPAADDAKYAELAECNFTLAFEGDVDLAWKHGMRTLVKNGPTVDESAAKPGFLGVVLSDEPVSADFPQLALQSQQLLARHPYAIPYVNLNPTYAPLAWLGTRSYEDYVEQFITVVKPKVLSFDHYPLLEPPDGLRPDYYSNLQIVRGAALRHGIPFWFVLLATPLGPDVEPAPGAPHLAGPYADPTEGELRWQVFTALAYGAQGLMYFTYCVPAPQPGIHFGDAIIRRDGTRDRKYGIVKRLNAEVQALGPTLLRLTSTAVYHVGPGLDLPQGANGPAAEALVAAVSSGHLVVGEFAEPAGGKYLLLANGDYASPFAGEVRFSPAVTALAEVPRASGRSMNWVRVPPSRRLQLPLPPGDGCLYRVR